MAESHYASVLFCAKNVMRRCVGVRVWIDCQTYEVQWGYESGGDIRLIGLPDSMTRLYADDGSYRRFDDAAGGLKNVPTADDIVRTIMMARADPETKARWAAAHRQSSEHAKEQAIGVETEERKRVIAAQLKRTRERRGMSSRYRPSITVP